MLGKNEMGHREVRWRCVDLLYLVVLASFYSYYPYYIIGQTERMSKVITVSKKLDPNTIVQLLSIVASVKLSIPRDPWLMNTARETTTK